MNQVSKQRRIIDRITVNEKLNAVLGERRYDSPMRQELVEVLKEAYQAGKGEVQNRFNDGGDGTSVLHSNAFLIDQLIRVIFDFAITKVYPIAIRTKGEEMSVVALGGYGRAELAPFSDVDLMFLIPYKETPHNEQVIEFILYMLWDLNLKVGHSTRSVDDSIRLARQDLTIRTAILDARWLWGDQELFRELHRRYMAEISNGTGPEFVEAKLAERDERHDRLGDTRYVVEPNVKEGKGGLRDLQTLYWLTRYLYNVDKVEELAPLKVFTKQDVRRYRKACDFLWTVRCHLHYLAGRAEERLTFDIQKTIGELMGYADRSGSSGVERFMKHYFLIAKDVGDLTRVLCAVLEEQQKKRTFFRLPGLPRRRARIDGFQEDRGRINLGKRGSLNKDPRKLIRIFYEAQAHDLDIHPEALRRITRNLRLINKDLRLDPEANRLFVEILSCRKDPEISLTRMNEAGVLGKFIPDFGRVVAQMQYDMYHTYTVDEHTIRAIGILSRIEKGDYVDELPNMSQAVKELQSRRALYVALLLHDIAKGRGGDHSELGAEVALELCPRLGLSEEETETVTWLVRHHLVMSDTAFKRDVDNAQTIQDFVEVVKSVERLRLLAVLTVADIRAVGPNVWNNWKSGLLRTLFLRSMEVMSGDLVLENRLARIEQAKEVLRERLVAAPNGWSQEEIETHIATGYPYYWLTNDAAAHFRYAEIVLTAKRRDLNLHIETRKDAEFGYTDITVYAPDHPGLFSRIAGAMALSNASIRDSKIVTLSDGMVLDSFAIQDPSDKAFDNKEKLKRLWQRIELAIAGELNPGKELTARGNTGLPDRNKVFQVATRVLIDNAASRTHSVVEINGRDRPGLLYDVTAALTELGLQISSAHIATYGEHVVDSFYVKDVFGLKIEHEDKLRQIRRRLLEAVERDPDQKAA